ncbi:DoxX family protein [Bacillus sp. CMF21]|uniref:DoxX family protein n=1 Tax=Metabacillus dongyingensis TaxID=2874282 RepID=UPI001CC0FEB6|nr:DoxX family protein [Metabacillus dongyingensis]UAL51555.1 DoxX family protein [Metabacillus dongyingensis]USK27860.1 DoxX family protein [Bacillus sp. CMF21]
MTKNAELGGLILRIALGFIFFVHGLTKFQGGVENTAGFFDSIGVSGFLAYPVAIIEAAGGILLMLGLGTRIVAALFGLIMLGAIFTAKLGSGFIGGYELDVALLAMSIYLVLSGSEFLSLEKVIIKDKD